MLKHSVVFSNDNILSTISKTIQEISVFIQPSSIISPIKDIEDLNLMCNEDDLNSEKLMIEFYSDESDAKKEWKSLKKIIKTIIMLVCGILESSSVLISKKKIK